MPYARLFAPLEDRALTQRDEQVAVGRNHDATTGCDESPPISSRTMASVLSSGGNVPGEVR